MSFLSLEAWKKKEGSSELAFHFSFFLYCPGRQDLPDMVTHESGIMRRKHQEPRVLILSQEESILNIANHTAIDKLPYTRV